MRKLEEQNPGFTMIQNHIKNCDCQDKKTTGDVEKDTMRARWQKVTLRFVLLAECARYACSTILLEQLPDVEQALTLAKDSQLAPHYFSWQNIEDPEEAHLVYYFTSTGGHWGVYRGNGVVESTWGWSQTLFRHGIWQVPKQYGNEAKFYKLNVSNPLLPKYWE